MTVEQLNGIVNTIHKQVTGKTEVTTIDTSNIVDIGKEIFDNTQTVFR